MDLNRCRSVLVSAAYQQHVQLKGKSNNRKELAKDICTQARASSFPPSSGGKLSICRRRGRRYEHRLDDRVANFFKTEKSGKVARSGRGSYRDVPAELMINTSQPCWNNDPSRRSDPSQQVGPSDSYPEFHCSVRLNIHV
ncbi:hypothetical protein PAAG_04575 [Paracoccidioides lutzii Pb01]|uniref:Uncharacterized protein n=1 Tax=Paracoccidioides lutzii (strain ATCC MYA-826 / Pb01) TaxID=502779 RepID=C1H1D1_PARBA|nr:hypothetical protein PAAG_04575 [Paracoccidioides lutzii Pb01]EEH33525.2 hypothetical protein PAAG_04575 [Paracoccidioides lutzii Pb01]